MQIHFFFFVRRNAPVEKPAEYNMEYESILISVVTG